MLKLHVVQAAARGVEISHHTDFPRTLKPAHLPQHLLVPDGIFPRLLLPNELRHKRVLLSGPSIPGPNSTYLCQTSRAMSS